MKSLVSRIESEEEAWDDAQKHNAHAKFREILSDGSKDTQSGLQVSRMKLKLRSAGRRLHMRGERVVVTRATAGWETERTGSVMLRRLSFDV